MILNLGFRKIKHYGIDISRVWDFHPAKTQATRPSETSVP